MLLMEVFPGAEQQLDRLFSYFPMKTVGNIARNHVNVLLTIISKMVVIVSSDTKVIGLSL